MIPLGVEGSDAEIQKAVRKAAQDLRIIREVAKSIAREPSEISTEEPVKEEDITQREDGEWESLQTLKKIRSNEDLTEKLGKPGQTEITLKDDLPERDRTDLYKKYLLFCLTVEVHRGLAEQAFRQQAEIILADGQYTKARVEQEQLSNLQKQRSSSKKTVDDIDSSGMGEFDDEEVYEKIPSDLNINKEKARQVFPELAKSRLSNLLVQGVSLHIQKSQGSDFFTQ
ncbi:hypothetical protein ACSQ67_005969 [Phaseolus vulgaris]